MFNNSATNALGLFKFVLWICYCAVLRVEFLPIQKTWCGFRRAWLHNKTETWAENSLNPLYIKHNNKIYSIYIYKCMYSLFLMAFNAQQDHRANTGTVRTNRLIQANPFSHMDIIRANIKPRWNVMSHLKVCSSLLCVFQCTVGEQCPCTICTAVGVYYCN